MLIDWITLKLRRQDAPDWGGWRLLAQHGDRILRIDSRTGLVKWEVQAWESIRSDSHSVTVRASAWELQVTGSPARVLGDGDTVFGPGESGRSLVAGASAMLAFASSRLFAGRLPEYRLWAVRRVDVTKNYDLGSVSSVRVALTELRGTEGGRYRVSQQAGDTTYWSHRSRLRAGKAYAKGPHLAYLAKKGKGIRYTPDQMAAANRLLRLELTLGSQWWRERIGKPWWLVSWNDLEREHKSFFERMVGVMESGKHGKVDVIEACMAAADTPRQGRSAAGTWGLIQAGGWQAARESMSRATWYRHLSILRSIGLGDADLSAGRIVSLRRETIMRQVSSWDQLRAA